jgi:hypothetical protein
MKRLLYLVTATLVAMLILVPTATAQETTALPKSGGQTQPLPATGGQEDTQPLPKSGGVPAGSILLPAAALLVGGGVLGYAILRRR